MQVIAVIPVRWQSTRFPGKPLADLLGKSLIQRTYENAKQATLIDRLVVATDDKRIFDHVQAFGGEVYMTSPECVNGTERVAEVIETHFPDADYVLNVQGDEPCLNPLTLDRLIKKMEGTPEARVTTPITKIEDPEHIFGPSAVKCVFDRFGKALYFSRAPIPFPRKVDQIHDYYRHIGIYCFRGPFLLEYVKMPTSRLQSIEDLEQLKILEAGHAIYVEEVAEEGIGVDTPEDLTRVIPILKIRDENLVPSLQASGARSSTLTTGSQ